MASSRVREKKNKNIWELIWRQASNSEPTCSKLPLQPVNKWLWLLREFITDQRTEGVSLHGKKPGFPIYLPKPHLCVLNTSHWIKVKWKRRSPDQQHFFPLGAAVINLVVFHPRPPASPCFRLLKAFSSLCSGGGEAVLITERKRGERTEKHDLWVWICRTIEGISARMQMCVNAKQSTATQMIFFVIFMVPWNKKTQRKDYEIYSFVSRKSVQVKGFGEMHWLALFLTTGWENWYHSQVC